MTFRPTPIYDDLRTEFASRLSAPQIDPKNPTSVPLATVPRRTRKRLKKASQAVVDAVGQQS